MSVDLNCDMGEIQSLADAGTQERLLRYVTSVNVSCGAHAGTPELIEQTILQAKNTGVNVGAHPGYPDLANFGRVRLDMEPLALTASIAEQLDSFGKIAKRCGVRVTHIKPHGALYNEAARDESIAVAIAKATAAWDVPVIGLYGSIMLEVWKQHDLKTIAEAFCDRRYEADGTLRPRNLPGALITDPHEAAEQAIRLAPVAGTLCIHSDTPNAVAIAAKVCAALSAAGLRPIMPVREL